MQEQLTYIQLPPEYSPLVELATRLGYRVYLYQNEHRGGSMRYRIDNRLGRWSEGNDLVDALAFMIKREILSVTTPVI